MLSDCCAGPEKIVLVVVVLTTSHDRTAWLTQPPHYYRNTCTARLSGFYNFDQPLEFIELRMI